METEGIRNVMLEPRNRGQTGFAGSASRHSAAASGVSGVSGYATDQELEEIASSVNEFLESVRTDLRVEIHRQTHTPIFKVVRKQDNKVIQEVPPRTMLEIKINMQKMAGAFLNMRA